LDYVFRLWERDRKPIRIDPAGTEGMFIRPLRELGVEVVEVSGREYQQACGELVTAVVDGGIRHLDQSELNRAASSAGRRNVGAEGGWAWIRLGVVDISPLKAATVALSGVTAKRGPRIHSLASA
jgi:hypothetical protein